MNKTIEVGEFSRKHPVGNSECEECWGNYPSECSECKKGLVHAEFGDENYDGDYWLYTKCDVCGEREY